MYLAPLSALSGVASLFQAAINELGLPVSCNALSLITHVIRSFGSRMLPAWDSLAFLKEMVRLSGRHAPHLT